MSKHIIHKASKKEFLIIEVPKGAANLEIRKEYCDTFVTYGIVETNYEMIPLGEYRILFIAETATEEQAAQVVNRAMFYHNGQDHGGSKRYINYCCPYDGKTFYQHWDTNCDTSTESLHKLILFNFTENMNHLIIEKL